MLREGFGVSGPHIDDHLALHRRFNSIRSVKDYGAAGNWVKDDTQAFIDALSDSGVYSVFVPTGRYRVTSLIQSNADLASIYGVGRRQSYIIRTGAGNLFESGGKIDFRDVALFAESGSCLVTSANDALVRDCWLHNHAEPMINSATGNLTISGCVFEMGRMALRIGGAYINVSDSIFYDIALWAIKAIGAKAVNLQNILIETRTVLPPADAPIQFSGCADLNLCNLNLQRVFDADGKFPIGAKFIGCNKANLSGIHVQNVAQDIGMLFDGCAGIIGNCSIGGESGSPTRIGIKMSDSSRCRLMAVVDNCAQPAEFENSATDQVVLI